MKFGFWMLAALGCLAFTGVRAEINLVPKPVELAEKGTGIELAAEAVIAYADEAAREPAEMLAAYLRPATGFAWPVQQGEKGTIVLKQKADHHPSITHPPSPGHPIDLSGSAMMLFPCWFTGSNT